MARNYSTEIANEIERFLEEDDWKFNSCDENGVIRTALSVQSKIKKVRLIFSVSETAFTIYSILPLQADEEKIRTNMAEFLTRANYGIKLGNFEMDFDDGEIRYKTAHCCGDTVPTQDQIRRNLYTNVMMVDRYGNGIVKVLFGIANPKEAVEECEEDI